MGKRFLIWDNPRDALVNLVYFLMILGGVNIFSASFVAAADMFGNGYHYLIRYAIYGAIGLGLMHWVGRKWDYHQFFRVDQLLCVGCTVLLIAVDIFGKATKGAQRWLILGPFSFQPSEFVKLAVILLGAHFLGRVMEQGKTPHLHRKDTCQAFLEAAFMSFLVLIQPDMGTASIILTLMIVLYLLAGLPWKEFGILVGVLLGGAVAAVIQAPYRLNRMRIWLTPELDAQGNGYQAVQAKMAIGSGGIFGEPFGMGTSKFFYLPEAHTGFCLCHFLPGMGLSGSPVPDAGIPAHGTGPVSDRAEYPGPEGVPAGQRGEFPGGGPGHCQYGHGLRHPAGNRGSAVLHQLWGHFPDHHPGGHRPGAFRVPDGNGTGKTAGRVPGAALR